MTKKELTITSKFLVTLLAAGDVLSTFFPTPKQFKRMAWCEDWKNYSSFKSTLYRLYKQGWIEFVDKNNKKFVKLTKKGKLQTWLNKMSASPKTNWDGKWRLVMWDIPEESMLFRDHIRRLIKQAGFIQLQASVFISPCPISSDAISYLKESGLMNYIRIAQVEKMDNDSDLRKKFNLTKIKHGT